MSKKETLKSKTIRFFDALKDTYKTVIANNKPKKKVKKKPKNIAVTLAVIIGMLLAIGGYLGYAYYQDCIAPYSTIWVFGDTSAEIQTEYKSKYNLMVVKLDLKEKVEQWQLDEYQKDTTDLKLTVKSSDGIKKELLFANCPLVVGQTIKGNYVVEHATIKDYMLIKDILRNENGNISFPTEFSVKSAERNKLKQAHYRKIEEAKRQQLLAQQRQNRYSRPSGYYRGGYDTSGADTILGLMFLNALMGR